ncbi:hypothetical protein FHW23_000600 [Curtobacterium pusillum]|uniref:Uncharacterized protein n=1 Tax=Curtobacterium pusillum TaxID=69373 RepID=A0AAW3T2U1_9MICO|nr:hypothetical protein [Curtobacterium pusillum]MBA8989368.1 hypothetical protein [Curtobacterium pusillum]
MPKNRPALPVDRSARGRIVDAQLHLLDRQVLDANAEPLMVVDDIEIEGVTADGKRPSDDVPPTLTRLLAGATLGTRVFGGRPPRSRLDGVHWREVTDLGIVVSVSGEAEDRDLTWQERWLREHLVKRIPGGRHAPE